MKAIALAILTCIGILAVCLALAKFADSVDDYEISNGSFRECILATRVNHVTRPVCIPGRVITPEIIKQRREGQ